MAGNAIARSILALILFACSVGGFAATAYADQYVNGGVAWGNNLPLVDNTVDNPLGVNLFLEKEVDPSKVEKTLQMTHDAGIKWIRQVFAWNDIEISAKGDFTDRRGPGPVVSSWVKYDRIVDGARRYGLEIIARLDSPPVWARIPGDDVEKYRKGPPNNYNDYGDFVYAVVNRYKGKIKYFQMWNEPNLYGEWGGHPVSPEQYTQLLKVAHDAARRANPDAVIITAALAPTAEQSQANLNDVIFLERMYQAGAAPYFDILSTMLYGLGQSPDERRTDLTRLNFSRPILLHQVMEKHGDGHKPIWISEYGWISLPPNWDAQCAQRPANSPCGQNIWGKSVDEETQGKWLVEGYKRIREEWPWIGAVCIWNMRQPDPVPGEPANYFAILHDDFTPRPAYNAIKEYSKRFPIADTGTHPIDSSAVTTISTQTDGGQDSGPSSVFTTTVKFAGNRLDLSLCAICTVKLTSLDGGAPKTVDIGHGSGQAATGTVPVFEGLAYKDHTAEIQVDAVSPTGGASAGVPFDRFTVSQNKPLLNALGFPVLYGIFLLLAVVSGGYAAAGLGRWAGAALNLPRGRFSTATQELARNGAAVVGMALLTGLYMKTQSLPLILLALFGLGVLAFLKPSTALAGVVASIPFFWYPKEIRAEHFPLAETLLLLVFGALMARRIVLALAPRLAARLNFPEMASITLRPRVRARASGNGRGPSRSPAQSPPLDGRDAAYTSAGRGVHHVPVLTDADLDDLLPARWPKRPMTPSLGSTRIQVARVTPPPRPFSSGLDTAPLPMLREEQREKVKTTSVLREETDSHPTQRIQGWSIQALWARFLAWNRADAFGAPALAMLLAGSIAMLTLADPSYAKDSARAFRWVLVEPILFYFLVTEIVQTRRALWRAADFFVATAVAIACLGIWQYAADTNTLAVEGVSRVYGVYQHPNNLALYLGRVLPFVLCAGIFLPRGWRKTLYLLASVPIALTTFLTFSRGAYLGVTVAVIIAAAVGLKWRPTRAGRTGEIGARGDRWVLWASLGALLAGLLLVGTAALLPRVPERIYALGSGELRLELWQSSLRMLRDHPVFGVGPDQFLNQFQAHYITPAQQKESFTAHPHNIFLDYWLTLGIMGVPVLLWLLWRFFKEAAGKARSMATGAIRDLAGRAIALGLLASMLDFLIHGLVDNSYFLMDLAMIFWLSCGLLQVLGKERERAARP